MLKIERNKQDLIEKRCDIDDSFGPGWLIIISWVSSGFSGFSPYAGMRIVYAQFQGINDCASV